MRLDDLTFINLEPIAACQLRCPRCSRDPRSRSQKPMERGLYMHLLHQVPQGCEVRLFLSGEPFLDLDLAWRVEEARNRGLETLIHTNGLEVRQDVMQALPSCVSVSVDGRDPQQYEEMRPPARWASVRDGVENLLIWRELETKLILQTIVPYPQDLKPNSGLADLLSYFDEVYVRWPHNWAEAGSVEDAKDKVYSGVCSFLLTSMSVQADGEVALCCACQNAERVIGDAKREPLREIWGHIQAIAEQQMRGEYVEVCSGCERYGRKKK